MPAVTTSGDMETNTMECTADTTAWKTTTKATGTKRPVETTMMESVMMKEPEPEPDRYAVGVVRK